MDNQKINYKNILIINLGGIGDILLSTPALRALKDAYPQAKIAIMVVPRVYEFVKNLSYIDKAVIFHMNLSGIISDIKTLFDLRKKHFDLAVNMRTLVSKKSAKKIKTMLDMIKPRVKAGRDTEGRGYFFDIKINESDTSQRYEMEYDIELAELLGVKVIDRKVNFNIPQESIAKVNGILDKFKVEKKDILIGIHPGGKPSHRWPIRYFYETIAQLDKEKKCRFVITGDRHELSLAKYIIKNSSADIINLCAKLNIVELGALMQRCNVFIANDTGIIHIAAALNAPLVAIFGPGFLGRYDPRQISDKAIVLYKQVECAPCNKIECEDLKCLNAISVDAVLKAARNFLD